MALVLTKEVLEDEIAMTLAQAIAAANKGAAAAGIDVKESHISIECLPNNDTFWRINYGSRDYSLRRGGGFIVDVWERNMSIKQVLHGQ